MTETKTTEAAATQTVKLLLRRPALAVALSLSERLISELQAKKKIPFIRVGRAVCFDPILVVEALVRNGGQGTPRRRMTQISPVSEAR